jgi:hypothetical protein
MKRTLLALAAGSALVVTTVAMPTKADAHAWWIIPAVAGGLLVTGAIANAATYPYGDPYYGGYYVPPPPPPPVRAQYYRGGRVSVAPTCQVMRQRTPDGWRRVRVCG